MCIFVKGCLTFELEYILFRDVIERKKKEKLNALISLFRTAYH